MYAEGMVRKDLAKHFDVHMDTISTWAQRDDVRAMVARIVTDRTNRVLRRVDSRIEGILGAKADDLSLEELLKIRKEFLPDRRDINVNVNKEGALEELWERVADNPEAAAALLGLDDEQEED